MRKDPDFVALQKGPAPRGAIKRVHVDDVHPAKFYSCNVSVSFRSEVLSLFYSGGAIRVSPTMPSPHPLT